MGIKSDCFCPSVQITIWNRIQSEIYNKSIPAGNVILHDVKREIEDSYILDQILSVSSHESHC